MSEIRVRVADWAVGAGDDVLATIGLGSCVAIMLHDAAARIGALAHVLLPSEGLSRDGGNRAKFPSTAVPLLIQEMRKRGARGPYTAKLAGGSSMFASLIPAGAINMGERNIAATREALTEAGVSIVKSDVGGDHGRSVFFHVADGRVVVRSLKRGELVL